MTSFNKVIQLGNLTRDPEVRYAPNGTAVASFSIAVNDRKKVGDEWKDKVDYFDVIAFGKQAESCGQYLFKGDAALIEGKLQQRRWVDKDTGQNRSKVEIVAQHVTFMPKRQGNGQGSSSQGQEEVPPEVNEAFPGSKHVDEGDIPF
jgi:single-strand DNA-binding protein